MTTDASYTAVQQKWDSVYGPMNARERSWKIAALFAAFTAMIAVGGLLWMSSQTRVVPFVVATDGERIVALGRAMEATDGAYQRIISKDLRRWLEDLRTVTSDTEAQRKAIDRVYQHLPQSSQAQQVISEWYRQGSPLERAKTETVAVQVNVVLPRSAHTYELEWTETARDLYGVVKNKERWRVALVTAMSPPTDEDTGSVNPLGLYVTEANWAKVL